MPKLGFSKKGWSGVGAHDEPFRKAIDTKIGRTFTQQTDKDVPVRTLMLGVVCRNGCLVVWERCHCAVFGLHLKREFVGAYAVVVACRTDEPVTHLVGIHPMLENALTEGPNEIAVSATM